MKTLIEIPVVCQNGHTAKWKIEIMGLEVRHKGVLHDICSCPKHELGEGYRATGPAVVTGYR